MKHIRFLFRVTLMLMSIFFTNYPSFAHTDDTDLADPGQITFRSQVSTMDSEEIDPYSGTLSLTHKEVSLPGNGGLDLNIYRTYRTDRDTTYTALGSRWNIHMGRIKKIGPRISIELQDGTVNTAVKRNENFGDYIYLTKDFWKINMQGTPSLQLTDGTEIVFGHGGGAAYDEWYYATLIRKNNSTITITYPEGSQRIANIVDSTGRIIDFNYQSIGGVNHLTSISRPSNIALVNYYYSETGIFENVTYPDGDSWTYRYEDCTMLGEAVKEIDTPYGGTIRYNYDSFTRANTSNGYKFQISVSEKSVFDNNLLQGTWTYLYGVAYTHNGSAIHRDYTTITDPCNRTTTYHFYGYSGGYDDANNQSECYKYGLMRQQFTTNSAGQIEEAIEYTWDKLVTPLSTIDYDVPFACHDYETYVPVISRETIYHGGTVNTAYTITLNPDDWGVHPPTDIYTTQYENYDAYGNPRSIKEYDNIPQHNSSPALKTTTKTYRHILNANIVKNKPKTIRIDGYGNFPGVFQSSYDYDTSGNIKQEIQFGVQTDYSYYPANNPNGNFNLKSVTDANNHITTYEWDKGTIDKITNEEYAINRIINWDGTVDEETNGREYTTSYEYTPGMRIERIEPPIGNPTIFNYNFGSDTFTEKTRGGFMTKTSYDGLGRASSTLDSIGKTTSITYKPCGIKEKTSSNIGDTVNFDHLGRITTIDHIGDGQITYHHHSDKHIEIIDEENKHTHQYYTTFGTPGEKHLTSIKDAYNKTSTYTYNILGSLRSVNFGGTIRHFSYNLKNFLYQETHPESGANVYTFDNIGNVRKIKRNGVVKKEYEYDSINRLRSITAYPSQKILSYRYDDADNLEFSGSPDASVHYGYDSSNRMNSVRLTTQGINASLAPITYDDNDNLKTIHYPSGKTLTYVYNNFYQITDIIGFGGTVSGIKYYTIKPRIGLLRSYKFDNGKATTLTYNDRRSMNNTAAAGVLNLSFIYNDKRGNMNALINNLDHSKNKSFSYDNLSRLNDFDSPQTWGHGRFDYYTDGDRSLKIRGGTINYGYTANRMSSANGIPYGYNTDGDMTIKRDLILDYTPFHRMWRVRKNNTILASYGFDGNGQRIYKKADSKTEIFLRGPNGNILADLDSTGRSKMEYIYLYDKIVAKVGQPDRNGSVAPWLLLLLRNNKPPFGEEHETNPTITGLEEN